MDLRNLNKPKPPLLEREWVLWLEVAALMAIAAIMIAGTVQVFCEGLPY